MNEKCNRIVAPHLMLFGLQKSIKYLLYDIKNNTSVKHLYTFIFIILYKKQDNWKIN